MSYNVEIIDVPVKHRYLSPIELCWTNLKNSIRKSNIIFRMTDVRDLAAEFIAGYVQSRQ